MRCESAFTTDGYRNWKHVTEMNRDFLSMLLSKNIQHATVSGKKKSNGLKWERELPH